MFVLVHFTHKDIVTKVMGTQGRDIWTCEGEQKMQRCVRVAGKEREFGI